MHTTWIVAWILGAPAIGLLVLNMLYQGGTSAGAMRDTPLGADRLGTMGTDRVAPLGTLPGDRRV